MLAGDHYSDAGLDLHVHPVEQERLNQRHAEPLGDRDRGLDSVHRGQEHGELIPTQAGDHVAVA